MQALGMPPRPHITPHSFRRTYVSILLLASEFDLEWAMKQVGHADSKMTLEVYNQLQRVKREHGASFDRLIREARERLHGSQEPPPGASTPDTTGVCAAVCAAGAKTPDKPRPPRRPGRGENLAISRKNGGNRRRDSASGHKCFQSYALPTELSRRGLSILAVGCLFWGLVAAEDTLCRHPGGVPYLGGISEEVWLVVIVRSFDESLAGGPRLVLLCEPTGRIVAEFVERGKGCR
jgi:hypothetical protein